MQEVWGGFDSLTQGVLLCCRWERAVEGLLLGKQVFMETGAAGNSSCMGTAPSSASRSTGRVGEGKGGGFAKEFYGRELGSFIGGAGCWLRWGLEELGVG